MPQVDEGGTVTRSRKALLSSGEGATIRRIVAEVVGMADRGEPARDAVTRKFLTEIALRLEQEAPGQGLHLVVACDLPCAKTIATSRKAKRMKPTTS
jgi:hypothetical protein